MYERENGPRGDSAVKWRNVTLLTVGESGLRRNTPEACIVPSQPIHLLVCSTYVDGYVAVSTGVP